MKRIYLFLLLSFAVFAQTNLVRVPASTVGGSGAKCQLRGVAGTRTAAIDSINGVYNNPYFEFTVTTSGRYDLYYDSNGATGGLSYSKQTDWSGTYGRWISGLTDVERSLSFQEIADTDNDGKVETAGLEDSVITSIKIKTGEVKGINVADSTLPLSKLTTAAYNFIGSGGTVTNNPDDISLANKAGSTIGIKESYFVANDTTILKTLNRDSVGSFVNLKQLSSANTTGGGMFVYVDSAFAEGTYAFDTPIQGKQWVLLSAKNKKQIDAIEYGLIPDTTLNQTAKIQELFNLSISTGRKLIIPEGTYWIDSLQIDSYLNIEGANHGKTILKLRNNVNPVSMLYTRKSPIESGEIVIKNITIDGNAANNTSGTALLLRKDRGGPTHLGPNLNLTNFQDTGLEIGGGSDNVYFVSSKVYSDSSTYNINIESSGLVSLQNIHNIGNNGTALLRIWGYSPTSPKIIRGCKFEGLNRTYLAYVNSDLCMFNGNQFLGSGQVDSAAIYLDSLSNRNTLMGNSYVSLGTGSNIIITANAINNQIFDYVTPTIRNNKNVRFYGADYIRRNGSFGIWSDTLSIFSYTDKNLVRNNSGNMEWQSGANFVVKPGQTSGGSAQFVIPSGQGLYVDTGAKSAHFKWVSDTLCVITGSDTTRIAPFRAP